MKIYPKIHDFVSTSEIKNDVDIPISYINSDNYIYNYEIDSSFNEDTKTPVLPYEIFDKSNVLFFDDNFNSVYGLDVLVRQNDKYMYFPKNSKTFLPDTFNYSVICKRNMQYNSSRNYDLKVSCLDNKELEFSKTIMQIFGDGYKRDICPKNIIVNDGDMHLNSLVSSSIEDSDFLMINSKDGINFDDTTIDYDKYLSCNTNIWTFIDDVDGIFCADVKEDEEGNLINIDTVYSFKNPYTTNKALTTNIYIDIQKLKELTNCNIINIMSTDNTDNKTPIVLIEVDKKGFIILSHSSILKQLNNNSHIIYETLFNVYSKTYVSTKEVNEWICDIVPDYEAINNRLVKKASFKSAVPVYSLLNLEKNEVIIIDVICDNENVKCTSNIDGYIDFKLLFATDPITDKDSIKIYTHRKDIMSIYEILYSVENKLDVRVNIENDEATIILKPFKSSYRGINIKEDVVLKLRLKTIENYEETYITDSTFEIYITNGIIKIRKLSTENNYDDITMLSKIRFIRNKADMNSFDMRVRGGGASIINNEDLFDVCDILGHAYRPGGTLIISLPAKLKEYDVLIKEEINKHKIADHHLMILYYEEE